MVPDGLTMASLAPRSLFPPKTWELPSTSWNHEQPRDRVKPHLQGHTNCMPTQGDHQNEVWGGVRTLRDRVLELLGRSLLTPTTQKRGCSSHETNRPPLQPPHSRRLRAARTSVLAFWFRTRVCSCLCRAPGALTKVSWVSVGEGGG